MFWNAPTDAHSVLGGLRNLNFVTVYLLTMPFLRYPLESSGVSFLFVYNFFDGGMAGSKADLLPEKEFQMGFVFG